ncbi:MAG: DegT/DnrJ/EryC1/StrS family aminotransferase [Mucilaginibacter polytrichastri]|nr:DegT/DnrJ/EryC1/StrS family aminotransferase [Mucilaginibacter polytrichastri]
MQMVDLKGQYRKIKAGIDAGIQQVIDDTAFINGPQVKKFQQDLAVYLDVSHVITCANGTDALQIAFMALDLRPGDEVIVPCFTYVAAVEVIALLGLKPVLIDVDPHSFNVTPALIEEKITPKTKAIVPVHLFGQCADMTAIMDIATRHGLYVVEDTAQAIGAVVNGPDGQQQKAGTIGHIGCTSFFPSKNLGCYGDGGALYTRDPQLADRIRKIANHGQSRKYYHELVGINSRLDTLQAAILSVKLPELDGYIANRQRAAAHYDRELADLNGVEMPAREAFSTHVFHQYTVKVENAEVREKLRIFLGEKGIPVMIYYPVPIHWQEAFAYLNYAKEEFPVTIGLCDRVLSLPMHTELDQEQLFYITQSIKSFFDGKV